MEVGANAGKVWKALSAANEAVEVKALKKATKMTDKEIYAAFGWLLREGKISLTEQDKDVFVALV